MKSYNIAIIGTFDVKNYGDLLFPEVLENELKKRLNLNKLYMFSPNGGIKPFTKEKVYPIRDLEKIINDVGIDAIIIGGGNIIRLDKTIARDYNRSYEAAYGLWQIPILLACKYNIKVVFNAPGVAFPFNSTQNIFNKFFFDKLDYMSVRDEESKEFLGNEYKDKCVVVPDTINIISSLYSKEELSNNYKELVKEKIVPDIGEYVIFQTRIIWDNQEHYILKVKELLNYITKVQGKKVMIMPIGYVHNDIEICRKFIDKDNKNIYLIEKELSPYDMLSVVATSNGFIGTSLHGIITSNIYDVKMLAINVRGLSKIDGFMRMINKENLVVANVDDLLDTYKNEFDKQGFKLNKELKKKITSHFDKIVSIITSPKTEDKLDDSYFDFLNILQEFSERLENAIKSNGQLENENNYLKTELNNLLNSKSFKITAPLRKIMKRKK